MRGLGLGTWRTVAQPLYGLIHTGQSLSTGDYGTPPLSTSNVGGNLRLFDSAGTYATGSPTAATLSLTNLVAPMRSDKYGGGGGDVSPYPSNIGGESPEIAMANTLATLLSRKYAPSCVGQGGAAMSVIQKGGSGNAYAAALYEAQAIYNRAGAAGFSAYQVAATMLTHGEADATVAVATYQGQIATLQANFQTDLAAITGQAGTIPMLVSQQNSFPNIGGGVNNSCQAQWGVVKASPSTILGVCPKYQFPFQADRAHLTNAGYRLLGEAMARALYNVVQNGSWMPLIATSVSRSTNVVTVTFNVPVAPLTWSSETSPHQSGTYSAWAAGKGFEAFTGGYGGTIVGITSVAISGNAVVITCASNPDTIAYAMTPDVATPGTYTGGFPDGRCGNLQDSDTFAGLSGTAQTNRAWAFVYSGL